jgi:secreted trypsin-like serine protease
VLDVRHSTHPSTQQFCAGTLIAPQYVLTASHCLAAKRLRASNLRVAVGRTVLTSSQGELIAVDRWVRQRDVAVAVVRLAHPVETVQPIPMVAPGDATAETPGTDLVVAGWGDTIRRPGGGAPRYPTRLTAATVPVRPDRACNTAYRKHAFRPADEVCAGGTGTDVCFGDSGGPIFVAKDGFRLVGVTIGGYGCGTNVPGIYAQLSAPRNAAVIQAFIEQLDAGSGTSSVPPPTSQP